MSAKRSPIEQRAAEMAKDGMLREESGRITGQTGQFRLVPFRRIATLCRFGTASNCQGMADQDLRPVSRMT